MHQHVNETNTYYLNNEIESNLKNVFTNRNFSIQVKIAKSDPRKNISRKKFHNSINFNN